MPPKHTTSSARFLYTDKSCVEDAPAFRYNKTALVCPLVCAWMVETATSVGNRRCESIVSAAAGLFRQEWHPFPVGSFALQSCSTHFWTPQRIRTWPVQNTALGDGGLLHTLPLFSLPSCGSQKIPQQFILHSQTLILPAVGIGRYALAFAVLRKIVLEIPALYVWNHFYPLYGLAYAQATAVVIFAAIGSAAMIRFFARKQKTVSSV